MITKRTGLIGLSFVITSVVVINVFSYNPNPKVQQIAESNKFNLLISGENVADCQLVNYIEQGAGGDLIFNCPSSNLIDDKSADAELLVNSLVSKRKCKDDATEYNSVHVFKCSVASSALN
tara:strand:- start:5237 stop:5599 length:363 start_codon:yes stop_codon:yes gene_type:complete